LSGIKSKASVWNNSVTASETRVLDESNVSSMISIVKKTVVSEQLFTNAQIVLSDEILRGCVQVIDGVITDISAGNSSVTATALDCQGDYLIPGLIELHTDHLETHYSPRPGVRWAMLPSIQAHDAQIAAAGITTVFDCLRCGQERAGMYAPGEMSKLAEAMQLAREQNRLRVEHRLHLRCEVSAYDVMDDFRLFDNVPDVRLVSLMDHSPGQRQFPSLESYVSYHQKRLKMSDKEFSDYVDVRVSASAKYSDKHRQQLATLCADRGIPLASHDDATLAHAKESIQYGVRIAEFPTTLEAARESHRAGLGVLMGAPNVVRGESHTGNVAARTLLDNNCLDVLSSDYIPSSLLQAVFLLAMEWDLISLPEAIALVTKNPATAMKMMDRGEIAVGRRADLVRVAHTPNQDVTPIVRSVWRDSLRVM
jgi:alpha-D-ribose 1-methylphosphonate 5-triphosphate diphosphatase